MKMSETYTQRIRIPSSVIENAVRDYLNTQVGYAEGFTPKIITIDHSFIKNPYITFKVTYVEENDTDDNLPTISQVENEDRKGLYQYLRLIK